MWGLIKKPISVRQKGGWIFRLFRKYASNWEVGGKKQLARGKGKGSVKGLASYFSCEQKAEAREGRGCKRKKKGLEGSFSR